MKTKNVVLKITYDEWHSEDPANWDWRVLLDLGVGEEAEVIDIDIEKKREEAKKLIEEAEAAREQSGHTDIDALEQSVYNQAVLDVLEMIENSSQDS